MQRGGASSVPRMRSKLAVTGTVSAKGTPGCSAVTRSEQWKSTRKAAQHAPQLRQAKSDIKATPDGSKHQLIVSHMAGISKQRYIINMTAYRAQQ